MKDMQNIFTIMRVNFHIFQMAVFANYELENYVTNTAEILFEKLTKN